MKIYASLNNDKSLEIFQDIAGGNIWVKVKFDLKLTTYIKIYSVSITTEDIPYITYSSLPFWSHEYLDFEEDTDELYDDDYEAFQRLRTKQTTRPARWFEVVTPVQMFTDDEIDEIISSYPIVHDG